MRRRLLDYAVWLGVLLCCTFLGLALAGVRGAFAQEIKTGLGLICDTPQQVERYVALYKKGDDGRLIAQAVNAEVGNDTACAVAPVAFHELEEVGKVRGDAGTARIVKIVVVAAQAHGVWNPLPPFEQFCLFLIPEEGA